jgi:hypothetical protein
MKIFLSLYLLLSVYVTAEAEIIQGQAVTWSDFSHITCIAVGQEYAYFGTTEGILRYQIFENKWYDPITVSDGLGNGYIRRLAVSFDDQNITAETDAGIYDFESTIDRWLPATDFPTEDYRSSVPPSPLPQVLMPFGYRFSVQGYVEDDYFRQYQITAWIDDGFSHTFAGTWGRGPLEIDDNMLSGEFIPCGLLQKQTDVIYFEGDSIWLAGNAGDLQPQYADSRLGVTLFDRADDHFTYFEPRYLNGFNSEIIYDIAGDEKNLYFAGRQGLTIKNRSDDYYFTLARGDGLPETETTALAVRSDSVWVGTALGLALYTPSVDTLIEVGASVLGQRFITALKLAGERLIIGTDKGAYYIDVATKKIGRLKDPNGNLGGFIHHVSIDRDEILIASEWALTRIDMKTHKAALVPFTDTPGGVYAAVANDKYIAAVVDNGLMLLERETGRKRIFDERDGLPSINISVMVADGDYLWLGSDQGLTRFQWVNPNRTD